MLIFDDSGPVRNVVSYAQIAFDQVGPVLSAHLRTSELLTEAAMNLPITDCLFYLKGRIYSALVCIALSPISNMSASSWYTVSTSLAPDDVVKASVKSSK